MVVKGNQPTLQRDIAEATAHRGRCTGHAERVQAAHGRIERRSLWVGPGHGGARAGARLPFARQIWSSTRHVISKRTGQVHEETVYAVTSLSAEQADAAALLRAMAATLGIENGAHWVRDVVFG